MSGSRLIDEWGHFTAMPEIVIQRWAELGTDAIAMFLYLRYRTNRERRHPLEGCAWPDLDTIGQETGMHYRRIGPALKILEKAGLLTREKRFGRSVVYTLQRPPDLGLNSPSTIGGTEEVHSPSTVGGTVPPPLEGTVPPPLEGDLYRVYPDRVYPDRDTPSRGSGVRITHDAIRRAVAEHFAKCTGLDLPAVETEAQRKSSGAAWWAPIREICELVDWRETDAQALVDTAIARLGKGQCSIAEPRSILKTARAIIGEVKRGAFQPEGEPRGYAGLRAFLQQSEEVVNVGR